MIPEWAFPACLVTAIVLAATGVVLSLFQFKQISDKCLACGYPVTPEIRRCAECGRTPEETERAAARRIKHRKCAGIALLCVAGLFGAMAYWTRSLPTSLPSRFLVLWARPSSSPISSSDQLLSELLSRRSRGDLSDEDWAIYVRRFVRKLEIDGLLIRFRSRWPELADVRVAPPPASVFWPLRGCRIEYQFDDETVFARIDPSLVASSRPLSPVARDSSVSIPDSSASSRQVRVYIKIWFNRIADGAADLMVDRVLHFDRVSEVSDILTSRHFPLSDSLDVTAQMVPGRIVVRFRPLSTAPKNTAMGLRVTLRKGVLAIASASTLIPMRDWTGNVSREYRVVIPISSEVRLADAEDLHVEITGDATMAMLEFENSHYWDGLENVCVTVDGR